MLPRWSLRFDGALAGTLNMARDHALALELRADAAVLRLYGWARPTLSLGRNEPARGVYHPTCLRDAGVDVVRRPTGGRAVLHEHELTYAVILPRRALGGARSAYHRVSEAIVEGLSILGVTAEIAGGPGGTPALDAGPCFGAAVAGEIVVDGIKLVGSAQARLGGALLQHGSIPLGGGLKRPAPHASALAAAPPLTLRDLLKVAPERGEVAAALLAAFRATLPGLWSDEAGAEPAGECELEEHYRCDAWTWRR